MLPIDELISAFEYQKTKHEEMARVHTQNNNLDAQSYNQGKAAAFRLAIDHIRLASELDPRLGQYYENRKEVP